MKWAEWAREHGTRRDTAYEWFHAGILPIEATQLTGTILVHPQAKKAMATAVYARVSSADPKSDLDRQEARLVTWATSSPGPPTRSWRSARWRSARWQRARFGTERQAANAPGTPL